MVDRDTLTLPEAAKLFGIRESRFYGLHKKGAVKIFSEDMKDCVSREQVQSVLGEPVQPQPNACRPATVEAESKQEQETASEEAPLGQANQHAALADARIETAPDKLPSRHGTTLAVKDGTLKPETQLRLTLGAGSKPPTEARTITTGQGRKARTARVEKQQSGVRSRALEGLRQQYERELAETRQEAEAAQAEAREAQQETERLQAEYTRMVEKYEALAGENRLNVSTTPEAGRRLGPADEKQDAATARGEPPIEARALRVVVDSLRQDVAAYQRENAELRSALATERQNRMRERGRLFVALEHHVRVRDELQLGSEDLAQKFLTH